MVSEWENGKSTQLFSRSAQSSQQTFQNWKKKRKKCRHLWCLSSLCSVVQPWCVVPFHLTAGYGQLLRRREITSFDFLSTREIKKRTARRRVQVLPTMSPVNWPTRKKQGRAGVRGYILFLLTLASKHTADDWRYRYDPETVPHINKHGGSTCVSKLRGHTREKKSQCGVMGSHPRGQPTLSLCCVVSGRNAPFFCLPRLHNSSIYSGRLYLIVSVSPHLGLFSSSSLLSFYVAVSRGGLTMWIYPCASLPIGLLVTRQLLGRRNTRQQSPAVAAAAGCFRLGLFALQFLPCQQANYACLMHF